MSVEPVVRHFHTKTKPLRGSGQALCEWLNPRKDNGLYPSARDLLDTHVPVDLVTDSEVESLLETVHAGRRAPADEEPTCTLRRWLSGTAQHHEIPSTSPHPYSQEAA
ncbi:MULTISPECIES: hypothetical protein [Streptomyces griseus group]|uniref:hypothetical protein n=1 Tax=Streptomyces griseus group TaxID=629295 RepID=UPI0036CE66D8|nr:hypothetical protein OG973_07180 [Streptomyces cyaneofuscatus]